MLHCELILGLLCDLLCNAGHQPRCMLKMTPHATHGKRHAKRFSRFAATCLYRHAWMYRIPGAAGSPHLPRLSALSTASAECSAASCQPGWFVRAEMCHKLCTWGKLAPLSPFQWPMTDTLYVTPRHLSSAPQVAWQNIRGSAQGTSATV